MQEKHNQNPWKQALDSAQSSWFRIYSELCRRQDRPTYLEDCRARISQDWTLALPVAKDLLVAGYRMNGEGDAPLLDLLQIWGAVRPCLARRRDYRCCSAPVRPSQGSLPCGSAFSLVGGNLSREQTWTGTMIGPKSPIGFMRRQTPPGRFDRYNMQIAESTPAWLRSVSKKASSSVRISKKCLSGLELYFTHTLRGFWSEAEGLSR
jgi:hypothetical protein